MQDANLGPQVEQYMMNKLTEEQKSKVQNVYNQCNEEVRQKVQAAL